MVLYNFRYFLVSIIIGLITVLGVWFLLMKLSNSQPAPYDPSPLAAALQSQHIDFMENDGAQFRWLELRSGNGEWTTKTGESLSSVHIPVNSLQALVILARGQGPSLAAVLFDFLKREQLLAKTIILSPSDGLVKDLRFLNKEDPHLITSGNGQAFMVRFIGLQKLGLANFPSTDFDVAWIDPQIVSQESSEIARIFLDKKIPTIVGPIPQSDKSKYPSDCQFLLF